MSEWGGQATLRLRARRRSARPTVRCMILLHRSYVHASLMRVPISSFRETNRYTSYKYEIGSTEPRVQAVPTAAAAQTSEMFGEPPVFEALHSLILHHQSSFCNTGTRDFTGTYFEVFYCRNMMVSQLCVSFRRNAAFFSFCFVMCTRMVASPRACVLACLADLPNACAGQATSWL